jgi:hypothetical protein
MSQNKKKGMIGIEDHVLELDIASCRRIPKRIGRGNGGSRGFRPHFVHINRGFMQQRG